MRGSLRGISIEDAGRRAFGETSDPACYVARPATDRVVEQLAVWSRRDDRGSTVSAIVGTPGLGKTMLLRLVEKVWNEDSAGPSGALYLPYGGLALRDLVAWIYGLLGRAEPSIEGLAESGDVEGENGTHLADPDVGDAEKHSDGALRDDVRKRKRELPGDSAGQIDQ